VKDLKDLLRIWEREEVKARRALQRCPNSFTTDAIDQYRREATDVWRRIAEDCEIARRLLKEVGDNDIKGLSDWAKEWLGTYSPLLNTIADCSVLGGTITFGAITSASHGDISLMCYSFLFSLMAFASSIGVHMPLSWYCRGPNIRIKYPQILECSIALLVFGGAASVAVAFVLLGACIQTMNRNPLAPPRETFSPLPAAILEYLGIVILCSFGALLFIIFMIWRLFYDPRVPVHDRNRYYRGTF